MRIKRFSVFILIAVILFMSTITFAADTSKINSSVYDEAVTRLTDLGILKFSENAKFNANDYVTREQFARIICIVAGLEDTASAMKGSTIYSDVSAKSIYSGYINTAVKKGYMSSMTDGKFHPSDIITYKLICPALVKVLGYTDTDVTGSWPKSYIEKAKALFITDGVTLNNDDKVPMWAMAVMINNLLDTNIKKTNAQDTDKTLAVASGLISDIVNYEDAVTRLTDLGILTFSGNTKFNANDFVTREQFAKIICIAAGLEDTASASKGSTIYSDVKANSTYNGYINTVVEKGYMSSMTDGKFHPSDIITFNLICPTMVKVLGYTDKDVTGTWPKNYIDKAKALFITEGITLYSNDKVPMWAMVVMIDRLLDTNIKNTNAQDVDKTLEMASNLSIYDLYTVYGKPEISMGFDPSTKKLGNIDFSGDPQILRNTIDISATPNINTTGESITINEIKDNDVVYKVSDESNTKSYILVIDNKVSGKITGILPNKISPKTIQIDNKSYDIGKYFDVKKINGTTGAFNVGDRVTALLGYDGKVATLVEDTSDTVYSVYSKPEISMGFDPTTKKLGNIDLNGYPQILRTTIDMSATPTINTTGESISINEIKDNDVVYKVSDESNTKSYILVVDNKVSGKITGILPNKISPKTIQIDNKSYDVGKYFDVKKVNSTTGAFNVGDRVTALLGYDGKVATLVEDTSDTVYSVYSKPEISMGFDPSTKKLGYIDFNGDSQILRTTIDMSTTPTINTTGESITINEIKDNDVVYKVSDEINTKSYILVIDNKVSGEITGILPNKISPKTIQIDNKSYDIGKYFDMKKINSTTGAFNVGDRVTVLFGYDGKVAALINSIVEETSDIVYSVHSKPEIAKNFIPDNKSLGAINFTDNPSIVRNTVDLAASPAINRIGERININQIKDNDVVYQVSDESNKHRYILVIDNKVSGKITGILPDKYSPKSIQIDGKSYEFGKYFNYSKINSSDGAFDLGDTVIILLGYDAKVAGIINPINDDTSNFAFVVNTSTSTSTNINDYGKITYTIKLLQTDGSLVTYRTYNDESAFKGKMVTYNIKTYQLDATTKVTYAEIAVVKNTDPVNLTINKDERQIGGNFVTDNVKIINYVSYSTGDCVVNILNWNDLPYTDIPAVKAIYLNYTGVFNDVNLIVLSDIYDQFYSYAFIKNVKTVKSGKTDSYLYTLLINGIEQTLTTNVAYAPDTFVRVNVTNGVVNYIYDTITAEIGTAIINAIDSKRIKVNNTIYRFKNNVQIFYKDAMGNMTLKGTSDIDVTKIFRNVSIYMDKSLISNGKVIIISISE